MENFLMLNRFDFEFVGYKYERENKGLTARTKLHKRGKKWRVYYYLPDGRHLYHNAVPKLKEKKDRDLYISEFRKALEQGFIPKKGAKALKDSSYDPKDGTFQLFFRKYFNDYATGARAKSEDSKDNQLSISKRIVEYFEKLGIYSISEITDKDIEDWDKSLFFTKKLRGQGFLSPASRNHWRKTFRAFMNTAKEKSYSLQCDPSKINIFEYKKGEIDHDADVRSVIYPRELINAVQKCSLIKDLNCGHDFGKHLQFWEEVGLRPGEMYSLSDKNIIFDSGRPIAIQIIDLNCPVGDSKSFTSKTRKSKRVILLSDFAISFIEEILSKFEDIPRYGLSGGEYVEYPYLFVFWNEKERKFVRDDSKFLETFNNVTEAAIQEFCLPYENVYIPYDLRRSCNYYLKTVLKYNVRESADFLGHSIATNEKHYTLNEDGLTINRKQIEKALRLAMQASSETQKAYSTQAQALGFNNLNRRF